VIVRRIGIAIIVAIAAMVILGQFMESIPANSPATGGLDAPPEIAARLRDSCADCHSNETHWPWYSRVPPVSWLVAHDVVRGRQELNFSEWNSYLPPTRRRKLEWMERALMSEKMPPLLYRMIHPASRVSDSDRDAIVNWIETQIAQPAPAAQIH
jgi:hypothetical protein